MSQHSITVSEAAYRAAHTRVASIDRSDRGRLIVSGADRAAYLQGLFTNDIGALVAGTGCYAAYLTPQGRMISDVFVYDLGDRFLLSLPGVTKEAVLARLDRFIFAEDVKVEDVTDAFAQIAIVGPQAAGQTAKTVDDVALEHLEEHGTVIGRFAGSPAIVARITDAGVAGFDVYFDRASAGMFRARLAADDVGDVDPETMEILRVEAGIPRFGVDMDQETIPLEAGLESRAISFTKGCYVGQEVVVRVLHRGHGRVARRLVGIALDGRNVPPRGAAIQAGDREIGRVTSSVWSIALRRPIVLGYVHRDFTAPGTAVSIDGEAGVVAQLPFGQA